jgi:HD-like signal output (HDOD) protein
MIGAEREAPSGEFGAEKELDRAVEELVARDAVRLPPYPAIALRIQELAHGGDYGLDELARLVRSDPVLAADLLRVANSAYYGGERVTSLERAVILLGVAHVQRLALASALGTHALARGPLAPLRRDAWTDALSSAVVCRALARARQLPHEDGFTCGLLHDFGRVVAVAAIERVAAGSRAMPARFWERVVDRHHVRLGEIVAERWNLPGLVADAIRLHHGDDANAPEMVEVVRISDAAVRLLGERAGASASDLARIGSLGQAETAALARTLRAVPAYVASLDRAPGPRDADLLQRCIPLRESSGPGVRVRIGGQGFVAIGVAPHQLAVRGPGPLPEGGLVEVEVVERRSLTFHARVLLGWPDGRAFGAVLMPFALSGPALLDWQGLVPASAEA